MKGQFDFSRAEHEKKSRELEEERKKIEEIKEKKLEAPHDMLIEEHSKDVIMSWRAPEFEMLEKDRRWYLVMAVALIAIVGYAVFTNSLIMAITFILIGVVGYMYESKEPRVVNFLITEEGIVAGREIYDFENIKSFWIFYEEDGTEILSLHVDSLLTPYIHIPFSGQDPLKIRQILIEHIPEEKHQPGFRDTLDRLLHL